jgi:hypothetical protein
MLSPIFPTVDPAFGFFIEKRKYEDCNSIYSDGEIIETVHQSK